MAGDIETTTTGAAMMETAESAESKTSPTG
jgi:hypothetical protein